MKTTVTREGDSKVKVSVEATPEEVAPALARAVRALGNEVKIPGFRKGHVPRKVLETRIGRDALADATVREAIPELLAKAVEEHEDLAPIAPPVVGDRTYELDGGLAFDATVEVRPEIELPNVELLTATRPDTSATDEEVTEQLQRMQERFASLETINRPARAGDYILCDIHATVHGTEIDGLSGSDQMYEVGTGWPTADFDRELDGKRTGDIVKFSATLPADIGGEHAGEEVTFQILVKEVRQKVTPALDDEFAKSSSEFETLDELRADLSERIGKVKAMQADADVRQKILEQVVDDAAFEPPESLVHQEMAFRVQRLEEQLKMSGLTLQAYLESQEWSEEKLESELHEQAERNVRAQLILEEVGRREGLTVSEDELREEVRYHAETLRTDANELAKQLNARGRLAALAGDIIRRKALNLLVERADIKEETPEVPEPAGEPAASPD